VGILDVIRKPAEEPKPEKILVIDIGGTKVKTLARGHTEPRKMTSGKTLTPARLVERIRVLVKGWAYEAVSIGYPGLVGRNGPRSEPGNLGFGWVGFDFAAAFGIPVRIINDAAMQALGSYDGGRMLFLGLGTGLGSTLITENVIIPLELGQLPYEDSTLGSILGRRGLDKIGKDRWRTVVTEAVASLTAAFVVDYVVIGGGNAKKVKTLPAGARKGHNLTAFRGGLRLWNLDAVPTQEPEGDNHHAAAAPPAEWRVI
jgi:polyphosphate glucokinase